MLFKLFILHKRVSAYAFFRVQQDNYVPNLIYPQQLTHPYSH